MSLALITPPADVPISLAELRAQVRLAGLENEVEDPLLAGYVRAATSWTEAYLGKALITQTWQYSIEAFPFPYSYRPFAAITIPLGPVQSITSITYTTTDGIVLALAPSQYELDGDRVRPIYGTTWPAARPGVIITFTAGYGPSWNDIPEAIRQGISMLAAYWYSQRESVTIGPDQGPASRVPYDTKELLMPFRAWGV